jgi:hypothetical protein
MSVATFVGRRWTEAAGILTTLTGIFVASVLLFGWEPWSAFIASIRDLLYLVESHFFNWSLITSLYSFLRSLGLSHGAAEISQYALSVLVTAALIYSQCANRDEGSRCWVLVCAILLFSPYQFGYALVLLLLPISLEYRQAKSLSWERGAALLLLIVNPLISFEELNLGFTIVPIILLAILTGQIVRIASSAEY